MKALTVKQPWAELIASGRKPLETRTWSTSYRGKLAIHAGKEVDPFGPPTPRLAAERGVIVAIADLVDCRPMTLADEDAACCAYVEGKYVFVLDNVRRLPPPGIPAKGKLGLWDTNLRGVA